MLTTIQGWLRDRRNRQEFLGLRVTMGGIHTLLFPENPVTGQLVRMKTGLRLEQHLERRLGTMGPDFFEPVTRDHDLERLREMLDGLPPQHLDQMSTEYGRLAERVMLEQGDPEEWDEDSGESTKHAATVIAFRLLSGWLKSKSVVHTSLNRRVIKEAQALEDLHFGHIQSLLRIKRGEKAMPTI